MANWIKNAIREPGSFTRAARQRGMSVGSFAAKVKANPERYSGKTRRRAALARTLRNLSRGR